MVFYTFKNSNHIIISSGQEASVSNQPITNEIFLLLSYLCFVFWLYLSTFVYVLYLLVSMLLSIYTSVPDNFGYLLSILSLCDHLAICMFWLEVSRFLIFWKTYYCQLQFPLQSSPSYFSSCTVIDSQILSPKFSSLNEC